MHLAQELQERIRGFVEGQITSDELRGWLDVHAQALLEQGGEQAWELANHAWTLFAEQSYGHRDEDSVRSRLAGLLPTGTPSTAVRTVTRTTT